MHFGYTFAYTFIHFQIHFIHFYTPTDTLPYTFIHNHTLKYVRLCSCCVRVLVFMLRACACAHVAYVYVCSFCVDVCLCSCCIRVLVFMLYTCDCVRVATPKPDPPKPDPKTLQNLTCDLNPATPDPQNSNPAPNPRPPNSPVSNQKSTC